MSQSNTGQAQAGETSTEESKTLIRQVRTKTRRKYAPEDKVRIVLEEFRQEGIKPGVFYAGSPDGKTMAVCSDLDQEESAQDGPDELP